MGKVRLFSLLSIIIFVSLWLASCAPGLAEVDDAEIGGITPSGSSIIVRGFRTYIPNLVSLYLQVFKDDIPATDLTTEDFVLKDDGQELAYGESYKSIKKADLLNYKFKTVVAVDVSGSIQFSDLEQIKDALRFMINNKANYQQISIVAFSDSVEQIIDFTTDSTALLNAVESLKIHPGAATDLYGAVLYCLDKWENIYGVDKIEMGMLVILTDGEDTAGVKTLDDVLLNRGDKELYAIGVGTLASENEDILKKMVGENGKYVAISDYGEVVGAFEQAQNYILNYISSFYMLYYMSPRRSGDHTMTVTVLGNTIEETYNADNFSRPTITIKLVEPTLEMINETPYYKLQTRLQTVYKYLDGVWKDLAFLNPKYELINLPSNVIYNFYYPEAEYYDEVSLTIKFYDPELSYYELTLRDEKYTVEKTLVVDTSLLKVYIK